MAKMPAPEKLKHLEKTAGHLTLSTEKIKIKLEKMEKVIQKMAFEFGSKEFTLKDRIDPLKLDSALRREFQNNGIDLNYGISLKTGTADSVVWERKIDNAKSKQFQTQLFPDDIINKNDRLQVAFPDTFRYFISTMWWMLSGSLLFTLIIIFAFAYTLQVIFKQKKISEIRNDFINNMTHEFKTPIATIRLAADALSNPAVASQSDKVNYYSDIIKEENERMNSHVESILNMALFDKNQFIPNPQVTDLHELLNQVIKSMQLQAGARGGTIATKFSAKNVYVSADLQFLPVVFMNLIDNAIKYSDRAPEVEVETFDSQNGIQVTVKDNGIGMDAGTLKQVFEKFYRVPTGNLHQVKGFGLGLSYARAIVVAHGGTISASSVPGSGSAFKVELPSSSSIA
jgi:signal transduction histidine kinase